MRLEIERMEFRSLSPDGSTMGITWGLHAIESLGLTEVYNRLDKETVMLPAQQLFEMLRNNCFLEIGDMVRAMLFNGGIVLIDGKPFIFREEAEYVSVWDSGEIISSSCKYDSTRMICSAIDSSYIEPEGSLTDEYVVFENREYRQEDGVRFQY